MWKRKSLAVAIALGLAASLGLGLTACDNNDNRPVDSGPGTDGGGGCGSPLMVCSGACTDIRFDPGNCGSCGNACATGEFCNAGSCSSSCGVGTVACDGRCVDTEVDPANCGSCGNACTGGLVCSSGSCELSCSGGTTMCEGACVDISSSVDHCGGCGNGCEVGTACVDGACGSRPTVDEDGDTISDFDEARVLSRDTDGDGTPDFMDDDSDNDGISDADEAGDADVMSPPVDSDGDGTPDFRDTDSDNDGITDADEVTGGTDPTDADSDDDGESDGVEVAGGSDPLDPTSTVGGMGDFTFDLPPAGMARTDVLEFNPRIRKADIFFLIDTTGSMGGTITGLRTSLSTLVGDVRTTIPDTAFGVARHDDFPVSPYGSAGTDVPFGLIQRVTTDMGLITAGVMGLTLHSGADLAESQIEGLYQSATGAGFRGAGGATWVPVFNPAMGFDASLGHGMIGGGGFRADSLPIIILATDITFHRAPGDNVVTSDPRTWCGNLMSDTCEVYGSLGTGADVPHTVAQTLAALNGIGARVFGLAVDNGASSSDQRTELNAFAVGTGAYRDPDASGNCATGVSGASRPAEMYNPDGAGTRPICPLVFSTRSDGTGVGSGITTAITDLTSFVSFGTLHAEARDNPATAAVDEARFFVRGIPVRADPATCSPAPRVEDRLAGTPPSPGMDGTFDTFVGVVPGCLVSFQIVAQNDGFVPATCADQIFSVPIIILGDSTVEADRRSIIVRVPGDRALCD